jgi:hypothetical protein
LPGLSWLLGRLDRAYGDIAFYVHLSRNVEETAASFVKRYERRIIRAYRGDGVIMGLGEDVEPMAVALDYCDTVNSNIRGFLKTKTKTMDFRFEKGKEDIAVLCERIGAEVDIRARRPNSTAATTRLDRISIRCNVAWTACKAWGGQAFPIEKSLPQ